MLIEDVAREFFVYLDAEKGCSPATIDAYGSDLRLFLAFLQDDGCCPDLAHVTAEVLRRYLARMSVAGLSASTRARRLYALRSLWQYLETVGLISDNPCRKVAAPRRRQRLPNYLSVHECTRLLIACDGNHYVDLAFRDRAILAILIYQGLRRAELLGVQVGDVDLDAMTLLVRRGKGGRSRLLPLAERAADALTDWLEIRPDCANSALFVTRGGRAMSVIDLQRMFRRTVARAGLRDGITLHTLRHTFATMLLREGVDVRTLQRLLGHASIETTALYLHVDTEDLRRAIGRHPLR